MRRLYISLHTNLTGLHRLIRAAFTPQVPRGRALVWGYIKIWWAEKFQKRRTRPLNVLGFTLHFASLYYLKHLYRELFVEHLYYFPHEGGRPRIIDAGANIGDSLLYYKYLYPEAEVVCFEPDPLNFSILEKNIAANNLQNVSAHQVAVAAEAGSVDMYYDPEAAGDTGQSASREFRAALDDAKLAKHNVKAVSLETYLKEHVDVLKIDVEGTEGELIAAIEPQLKNVGLLQLEFHYFKDNHLQPILDTLERSGFQWRIYAPLDLQSNNGSTAMIYASPETARVQRLFV